MPYDSIWGRLLNSIEIRAINLGKPKWMRAFKRFGRMVLRELNKEDWTVSVLLCDNSYIRALNHTYRGQDCATDVLSFSQKDSDTDFPCGPAGDVIISVEKAEEQAVNLEITSNEELKRLLIHGILHLDGRDHESAGEGEMIVLQEELLVKYMGVKIF